MISALDADGAETGAVAHDQTPTRATEELPVEGTREVETVPDPAGLAPPVAAGETLPPPSAPPAVETSL